jgi:hypothetical protein
VFGWLYTIANLIFSFTGYPGIWPIRNRCAFGHASKSNDTEPHHSETILALLA